MVKHLSTMQGTRVQSLNREDPLEKEMATHSSMLIWEIPWREEPGGLKSMELQRTGHGQATNSAEFLKSFQTDCFIWCLQQPCLFH